MQDYQLGKLREIIAYSKDHSRFYRELLAGIEPCEIVTFDDIQEIPFTTADMLVKAPLDFVCVHPGDIKRVVTVPTSGTTGSPKRIYFTQEDQELTIDFFHHGMSTMARAGDKVLLFLPCETEGSVGELLRMGLERLGCEVVAFGPVYDYCEAIDALHTSGCTCAVGLPAQIFALAELSRGIKPGRDIKLKSVLLCSDYISDSAVRTIEETWGCEAFGHYGMIETGLGGGVDCSAHDGYHMREADLLFEVVDATTGAHVEDGVPGELVFTTLTRRGMPLIRYKTGDISRVLTGICKCGSSLRRFERVSGRLCDAVALCGDHKLTMPMLDEALFGIPGIAGFAATLIRGNGRDILSITVYLPNQSISISGVSDRVREIEAVGKASDSGGLTVEIHLGGPEVLTYGNTKRRIGIDLSGYSV